MWNLEPSTKTKNLLVQILDTRVSFKLVEVHKAYDYLEYDFQANIGQLNLRLAFASKHWFLY